LPYYPQCIVRMARFKGNDKTEFIDNRQVTGNAFELYKQAQLFFMAHLPVAGKILPGVYERVDKPLYPPEALREAIANALCHRDYNISSGSIGIAIYDNRLELSSTGELRFGLKPEDLFKPHPSYPWNPIIARVFYLRGIIETWGRGTLKIKELTDEANLPCPEFENRMGEFIVRFFRGSDVQDEKEQDKSGTKLAPSWHQVGTKLGLSSDEVYKILISCREAISSNELMDILDWKDRTKFRNKYLKPLINEDYIQMTVPDKPRSSKQKYVLSDKGRALLIRI